MASPRKMFGLSISGEVLRNVGAEQALERSFTDASSLWRNPPTLSHDPRKYRGVLHETCFV